jgi:hypothetical protein
MIYVPNGEILIPVSRFLKEFDVPKGDELKICKKIIEDSLTYSESEVEECIFNYMKERFNFGAVEVRNLNKFHKEERKKGSKQETESKQVCYPKHVASRAKDILENGDAFDFIRTVWNCLHMGDKNIGENLLCSIGCTQVLNAKLGAHQKPSGKSGTGKSDAFIQMLLLLPSNKYITGSMSSKALFYDPDFQVPGVITYSDDATFSSEVVAMIKQATSNFQDETVHRTVNGDRKFESHTIPPRTTFWLSSVDSIEDEQLATRFFFGQVDESKVQDKRVNTNQKKRMLSYVPADDDLDVLTCRCIFDEIFKKTYAVAAPYIDAVTWNDQEHRRNYDKFLDILSGITVFNFKQRDTIDGMLVSTVNDCTRAINIYSGTAKSNALCLNDDEQKILWALACKEDLKGNMILEDEITSKELYEKAKSLGFTKSERTMTRMIKGSKGGMLKKISGLDEWKDRETTVVETTKGKDDDGVLKHVSREVQKYNYSGDASACILFQTVATIDLLKAEELDKKWRDQKTRKTSEDIGSHSPLSSEQTMTVAIS